MKLPTFVGFLLATLLLGCASSKELGASNGGVAIHGVSSMDFSSSIVSNDSTQPGPTWTGERDSVEKQKRIVITVIVVAAMITILTLGAAGLGK